MLAIGKVASCEFAQEQIRISSLGEIARAVMSRGCRPEEAEEELRGDEGAQQTNVCESW